MVAVRPEALLGSLHQGHLLALGQGVDEEKRSNPSIRACIGTSRGERSQASSAFSPFIRASDAFAGTVERIAAVPRPPSDALRLARWLGILRVVEKDLRDIGVALGEENKVGANHDAIRAERNGNRANNASFAFDFRDCRFAGPRLTWM